MEIRFQNINKEDLERRKKLIEELLKEDFSKKELNQENLLKAKESINKYKEAVSDNWNNGPVKIIIANSDGAELAAIR